MFRFYVSIRFCRYICDQRAVPVFTESFSGENCVQNLYARVARSGAADRCRPVNLKPDRQYYVYTRANGADVSAAARITEMNYRRPLKRIRVVRP